MMTEDGGANRSFREFAARLASGEDAAARQLLDRYAARLLALARTRLRPHLTPKADPEDLVQSALLSFFRRVADGEIELRDWSDLSGLLSLITLRKCRRQAERFAASRRDCRREVALDGGRRAIDVPAREPTAEELAVFLETIGRLLAALGARDRAVVEGLVAGDPVSAIADRIGCTERTVYRTVARVRQKLLAEQNIARTAE